MGFCRLGDRLADARVGDALDPRREEADLAGGQLVHLHHLRREDADLLDLEDPPVRHEQDLHARRHAAVDHAHVGHDALVGVVEGVEHERLERRRRVPPGRGNAVDDRLEDLGHPGARLGADGEGLVGPEPEEVGELLRRALDVGLGQVDLVEHRHERQVRVEGQVEVRERLRLDPLGGVDDQDGALARGEAPGHLVGEVDVPRRVDQVQRVGVAVARPVEEAHRVGLDRDPALALEVHRVEHLVDGLAGIHRPGQLEEPVGERGLPVVDVRDDREVADPLEIAQRLARSGSSSSGVPAPPGPRRPRAARRPPSRSAPRRRRAAPARSPRAGSAPTRRRRASTSARPASRAA